MRVLLSFFTRIRRNGAGKRKTALLASERRFLTVGDFVIREPSLSHIERLLAAPGTFGVPTQVAGFYRIGIIMYFFGDLSIESEAVRARGRSATGRAAFARLFSSRSHPHRL